MLALFGHQRGYLSTKSIKTAVNYSHVQQRWGDKKHLHQRMKERKTKDGARVRMEGKILIIQAHSLKVQRRASVTEIAFP